MPRRPLRVVSTAAVLGGVAVTLAIVARVWTSQDEPDAAFVSGSVSPFRASSDVASGVAMRIKARRWEGGSPNHREIAMRRQKTPSLSNMKDQYFILWARSPRVKQWYPINIVSGSEAAKNLNSAKDNNIAKAVGADKLLEGQLVKAIGMNLYNQKDEVKKQAIQMHPQLKHAAEIQYGYKEIWNNTNFNDDPGPFLLLKNISLIPPEEELRNLLDDAGDVITNASSAISQAGDNIKGFFSGASG